MLSTPPLLPREELLPELEPPDEALRPEPEVDPPDVPLLDEPAPEPPPAGAAPAPDVEPVPEVVLGAVPLV
ncbi:MAG TPA: N-acetylmuramoyl-L-alanine amidase, partial [Chloroflexota bacterium]|nr:N-acetylmuramoyl-L-alanine amidase [Chloroflexota bacterium]